MNTRGLTELIVLNIGLELGVISPTLFTMLVLMALVTTFMTGPALRLIDPHGRLSDAPEEALRAARLVHAGRADAATRSSSRRTTRGTSTRCSRSPAAALARSEPPRELILARLLVPTRSPTGIAPDDRELAARPPSCARVRQRLSEKRHRGAGGGVHVAGRRATTSCGSRTRTQSTSCSSTAAGRSSATGVPRGDVGQVLADAPCDVAVLVEQRRRRVPRSTPTIRSSCRSAARSTTGPRSSSASWIAARSHRSAARSGVRSCERRARRQPACSRRRRSLVQQLTGVVAEPVLVEPGTDVDPRGAEDAGLLVVGLPDAGARTGSGRCARRSSGRDSAAAVRPLAAARGPGVLAASAEHDGHDRLALVGPRPPQGCQRLPHAYDWRDAADRPATRRSPSSATASAR